MEAGELSSRSKRARCRVTTSVIAGAGSLERGPARSSVRQDPPTTVDRTMVLLSRAHSACGPLRRSPGADSPATGFVKTVPKAARCGHRTRSPRPVEDCSGPRSGGQPGDGPERRAKFAGLSRGRRMRNPLRVPAPTKSHLERPLHVERESPGNENLRGNELAATKSAAPTDSGSELLSPVVNRCSSSAGSLDANTAAKRLGTLCSGRT